MPVSVYIFIFIQLLYVSYIDIQSRKIANAWSIGNIFLFLVLVFFFPNNYIIGIETLLYPLGIFLAGFLLFILKIMGGGDSKYLASLFLLIPVAHQDQALISLSVVTVIVGLSVFITNILKNLEFIIQAFKEGNVVQIKKIFGKKFAFAPVILISWIFLGWKIKKYIFF
ncbi:prepilin peptidase [Halobacteriovorax sp. GFR7]|uniref:prepilin peptidase n=1 Tax=unclassified Halobacteriovorax TaxID=2639665 RepID=UPI003719F95A